MLLSDVRALFDQKVRSGLFLRLRRHAQRHIRDDRYQDALGMTWDFFRTRIEQGEIPGDGLLYNFCSFRMREPRPRLACNGEHPSLDTRLDLADIHPAASRKIDLDSAIDRADAVRALSSADREVLRAHVDGYDLDTIAASAGRSRSWASRRVQAVLDKLRAEIEA